MTAPYDNYRIPSAQLQVFQHPRLSMLSHLASRKLRSSEIGAFAERFSSGILAEGLRPLVLKPFADKVACANARSARKIVRRVASGGFANRPPRFIHPLPLTFLSAPVHSEKIGS